MIIVSQDRDIIVNFDSINCIKVEEGYLCFYIVNTSNNSYDITLARYKTEERAKEILRDIVEKYKSELKVYEMPEE